MTGKPGSSSRLQKLLNLLETGTSDATRKAAAKQLSEIARSHPDQLLSTVQKVHAYLYHKSWETRVAAGEALGYLADIFVQQTPDELRQQALACGVDEASLPPCEGPLTFSGFSLQQVLEKGTPLGASGGQEFDLVLDPGMTPKARLAAQRDVLKRRLGLDRDMGLDADALFGDEDLEAAEEVVTRGGRGSGGGAAGGGAAGSGAGGAPKQAAQELLASMEGLSARERNRLKRKAKALGRSDSLRGSEPPAPGPGGRNKSPLDGDMGGSAGEGPAAAAGAGGAAAASAAAAAAAAAEIGEDEVQAVADGGWPFQRLGDQLVVDSLDPVWEVRHGAALALRELLRSHAWCAAVEVPLDEVPSGWAVPGGAGKRGLGSVSAAHVAAAAAAHRRWLEDVILHLLCVLALDRFGDYGSDQVTAPVRETAAQALGMALQALDGDSVAGVACMLRELQAHGDWRVRYGGFCGLKYLLAARLDLAPALLPAALPLLRAGLADPDDDVRAACADALVPVAGSLGVAGPQAVSELRRQLWDLLPQLSDLSAATNSVMSLLAHLYGSSAAAGCTANGGGDSSSAAAAAVPMTEDDVAAATDELTQLVPRLWPFVRHMLSTVRGSVMQCLERMLAAAVTPPPPGVAAAAAAAPAAAWADAPPPLPAVASPPRWLQPLLPGLLQLVFQNVLVESEPRVQEASVRVWRLLVAAAAPAALRDLVSQEQLRALIQLATTQVSRPLDPQIYLVPSPEEPARLVPLALLRQLYATTDAAAVPAAAPAAAAAAAASAALRSPKRARTSKAAQQAAAAAAATAGGPSGAAAAAAGPLLPHDFVVGGGTQGEESVARMRVLAAQCLGLLLAAANAHGAAAAAPELLGCLASPLATARQVGALAATTWIVHAKRQVAAALAAAAVGQGAGADAAAVAVAAAPPAPPEALLPAPLLAQVLAALAAPSASAPLAPASLEPYGEVAPYYAQMRREVLALVAAAVEVNVLLPLPPGVPPELMGADHAAALLAAAAAAGPPEGSALALAVGRLRGALSALQALEQYLHVCVLAALAAASAASGRLPDKFNSAIQPLMNSLRREPQLRLQEVCAGGLAELLGLCAGRTPSPNDKLVRNIVAMATAELLPPPGLLQPGLLQPGLQGQGSGVLLPSGGSLSLLGQQQGESDAVNGAGGGHAVSHATRISRRGGEAAIVAMARRFRDGLWTQLPTLWSLVAAPLAAPPPAAAAAADPTAAVSAMHVLRVLAPALAPELLPSLRPLLRDVCGWAAHGDARVRAAAARAAAALARCWTEGLMPELLKQVVPLLNSSDDTCRLGGVEAVAALCGELGSGLVPYAVLLLVPLLRRMSDPAADVRAAAAGCFGSLMTLLPLAQGVPPPPGLDGEQLACVSQDSAFLLQLLDNRRVDAYALPFPLPYSLRPYQCDGVSWLAFLRRFGLHGVLADDMGLGKTLQASCIMAAASLEAEAAYVAAGCAAAAAPLPLLVVCPATLVGHWAHEVNSTIGPKGLRPLMYGGTPAERAAAQAAWDKSLRSLSASSPRLPYNLLVMSYEALRADVEWVAAPGRRWLYAVLDEGHAIRNPRSRVTLACKRVSAQHRLLLSGTPIQNDVLEMWSLFDFLMPGFLGPERAFRAKFGKALQEARGSKRGSREAEAGLLALEGLHRSLLPFVLRRTKGQVLADLPPKIITDIYCDLSELQARLYSDFQASKASAEAVESLRSGDARRAAAAGSDDAGGAEDGGGAVAGASPHVFASLQYLRKLCSHPGMVLDLQLPAHRTAANAVLRTTEPTAVEAALRRGGLRHAPKLAALRDILATCGVISPAADDAGGGEAAAGGAAEGGAGAGGAAGADDDAGGGGGSGGGSSGHRLLVFAQHKALLDLVERDLLAPYGVSYLRLDGGVEAGARFAVVQRFNADPTIDVLLLTTGVGGVGLNLTAADTVVFLEHDWNPMKDMQAMDRAHRLGQRRTVNVYRILTRGTLEERVLGLQQFKKDVAEAVVNADNMSMDNMDTSSLLDVFGAPGGGAGGGGAAGGGGGAVAAGGNASMLPSEAEMAEAAVAEAAGEGGGGGGKARAAPKSGLAAALAAMGEMWDESQYKNEFSMDAFMKKIGSGAGAGGGGAAGGGTGGAGGGDKAEQ